MAKILKNQTVSAIVITDTGVTVPVSPDYTIPPQDYALWAASTDIVTPVNAGDIIINDGVNDLSAARALDYISHPDDCFGIRFQDNAQRSNGLISRNAQEAIEEVKGFAAGVAISIIVFGKNGSISNAFLEAFSSNPSNTSPFVAPRDLSIIALSGSSRTSTSAEYEIRINGSGTPSETLVFSASTTATKDLVTPIAISAGDTVSAFVNNVDSARDAIFYIFVQGDA